MPVITFWSNNEKAIGQTTSAALVATLMAIEKNYKVLLISADYNNNVMEMCFGAQESNKEIVKTIVKEKQYNLDSGVNGLLKIHQSNKITPDIIHDYTKIIFKNRLEVLYSPLNIIEEKDEIMNMMKSVVINASRYYDQVIVDLKKGDSYIEQLEILEMSDVIVTNTDQRILTIENLLKSKIINKWHNKVIWNICKYDKNSKYNSKNLSRVILKKQNLCNINYNTLLLDACQEGNLVELLIRFKTIKEDSENLELISNIKHLMDSILFKYQEVRMKM